ncbi:MAG: transglycosylase SLT domain-containing protein [Acidobacteriota bacterium]|nr:transglycosylase SLT domain-containing protein [Acidobacteriota bacterium]
MIRRAFRLFAVLFCFFWGSMGQEISRIQERLEAKDYESVIQILENLKKANRKAFYAGEYDYLLARVAEKVGDFALASANYLSVIKRSSVLKEYALWHMAGISKDAGNQVIERIFLYELLTVSPKSLLKEATIRRLARSYFESEDFAQVENAVFINFSEQDYSPDREMQTLLGLSFLKSGRTEEAKALFTKILQQSEDPSRPDDFDLIAVKGLDELDKKQALTDLEHLKRGKVYFFNREFRDARSHFLAVVESFPQSSLLSEAMYLIGRSFFAEEDYHEAIKWFERVLVEFPNSEFASDALIQSASAFSRVNKPREAISRYRRYIDLYPEDERLDRVYLNIIDAFRDMGEEGDALNWVEKTKEKFPDKSPAVLANFVKARILIAQGNWVNALGVLEALQKDVSVLRGRGAFGGTNEDEVVFLKAYCLEQLKQYSESIELYFSISDGRKSYYGWRANERLKGLAQQPEAATFIKRRLEECEGKQMRSLNKVNAEQVRKTLQNCIRIDAEKKETLELLKKTYSLIPSYQKLPKLRLLGFDEILSKSSSYHSRLARKLLSLHLYDEGAVELEASLRERLAKKDNGLSVFPSDVAYTLALFYVKGEMPRRSIAWMESLWSGLPADFEIRLIPKEQLKILYPKAYSDLILKYAEQKGIDSRLILAIIRQESSFEPSAKSSAAARGLMQFIPSTASQIATEMGRKNFSVEDLYDPEISIAFGAEYLSKLFKLFPGQPQAVVASYNGGEKNMLRWLVRSRSNEPDRYVPEILFAQSKDYVFKVMSNYRIYQMLYDERLR